MQKRVFPTEPDVSALTAFVTRQHGAHTPPPGNQAALMGKYTFVSRTLYESCCAITHVA